MRISIQLSLVFCLFILMPAAKPLAADEVLVQVMSGQDEAAAQKEAERLFNLGVPAFSRAEQVPDKGVWNRVYLGPFETESDAAVAAETLKKQGTIKDFVVKSGSAPVVAGNPAPGDSLPTVTYDGETAIIGGGGPAVIAPEEPPLPVADIPTYGEPISRDQAQEMGLPVPVDQLGTYGQAGVDSGSSHGLTTYGQAESRPQAPAGSLPPGFAVGDDMPGLAPQAGVGGDNLLPPPAPPLPGEAASGLPAGLAPGDDMPGLVVLPPSNPDSGLPAGLAPGDDMPGLVVLPPSSNPDSGLNPADESRPAAGRPDQGSSAPATAPSAGEGDEPVTLLAQVSGADFGSPPPPTASAPAARPGSYGGLNNLAGWTMLVDLSSSMRRMTDCEGRIKEEAVAALLRKMNQRIPSQPYSASLRVFGYKMAITRSDFTTLYYGPSTYNRDDFGDAIAKLIAADAVSPFATALNAADSELQGMGSPKAILMFADFEESIGSGAPVKSASDTRRRYVNELSVYTFYITRQNSAVKLAKDIANAGGGQAYDICRMLGDDLAFEQMMMDIFGPGDTIACADQDGDGVCDEDDLCPNTPPGAPVDERGCWIAAYSQFFDFDKTIVKSAFLPRIKHAAEIMIRNPNLPTVIIAGHTDNVGTPEYNMQLGLHRAQSVYNLMVKYGVEASRLKVESFGETRPAATNDTAEGRARNRRVEFHIGEVSPRHRLDQ